MTMRQAAGWLAPLLVLALAGCEASHKLEIETAGQWEATDERTGEVYSGTGSRTLDVSSDKRVGDAYGIPFLVVNTDSTYTIRARIGTEGGGWLWVPGEPPGEWKEAAPLDSVRINSQ